MVFIPGVQHISCATLPPLFDSRRRPVARRDTTSSASSRRSPFHRTSSQTRSDRPLRASMRLTSRQWWAYRQVDKFPIFVLQILKKSLVYAAGRMGMKE